jgi:hypothetical protein
MLSIGGGVYEAHFCIGDEGEGSDSDTDGVRHSSENVSLVRGGCCGFVDCHDCEMQVGDTRKRQPLRQVVVPGIVVVKDGEEHGDAEVEQVVRGKGPEVKTIRRKRNPGDR